MQCRINPLKTERITMSNDELDALLGDYSDDELSEILAFVEQMGSIEDAQAAFESLADIKEAA